MTDLEGMVIMEPINHKIFLGLSLAGHLRRFSLSLFLASLFDFFMGPSEGQVRSKANWSFPTVCIRHLLLAVVLLRTGQLCSTPKHS